jgi:predicted regulator of Ras-like GTPase activity (Roadblock/LC7/MglB family)
MSERLQGLKAIEGVTGVVIAARDGVVLEHALEGDPEKEGAVAVFVGYAAAQVGQSLALGNFEWGTVAIGKETMLVVEQPDYYVGLLLEEKASPALVASKMEGLFRA